uniref:Uncharacterized protein n=1 Tax=Strombidium rassoulzadegani TaxID=1082188 RepID=A0A7S3CKY4_9SPIT
MLVEDADLQPRVVELYQELVLRVEWGAGVGHREVLGLQLLLACIELVILLARECLLEKPAFTIGTLILKRNCAWVLLVSRSLDGMVGLAKLVLAVGEGAVDHELAEVVLHPGLAELGLEVVVGHAAYSQDHLPRQGLTLYPHVLGPVGEKAPHPLAAVPHLLMLLADLGLVLEGSRQGLLREPYR